MAATLSVRQATTYRSPWSRRLSYFQDASLVCISAVFFYIHAQHAVETGSLANVFFAIEQALLVGMFLLRRRSEYTSPRPMDWVVATLGGWMPLLMRPHETGGSIQLAGSAIQMIGLMLVLVSFSSLGRSFGVVAANRGLKIGGTYQLVRHPIYFSHTITAIGFVVANFWWFNVAVFVVLSAFQVLRIHAEERVLVETTDYAAYKQRVRWRLMPGLY